MKTFEEIYSELKNSDGKELENIWNEAKKQNDQNKKRYKRVLLIFNSILIIICVFNKDILNQFLLSMEKAIFIPFILLILLSLNFVFSIALNIFFIGTNPNAKKYKVKFKEIVINKLINNFYDNVGYFPNKEMPEYIYKAGEYHEFYDIYSSEDYIECQINKKYSMQLAEVITKEIEEYKDSDGKTKTRVYTQFSGLFEKIVMDKSINNELRIARNSQVLKKQKLEMDSSEFEKYFDVETTDKILGMRILTADIMEELINFKNKTNMDFDIFIKDNCLYLRFHSGPMFESGSISNGALNKDLIKKYFYMLNFTYNLSNKLIKVVEETII